MKKKNRSIRYLLRFIPLFVTIFLFFILFSKIDLLDIVRVLTKVKLSPILLAILLSIISNIFLSAHKWQLSLKILKCYLPLKEAIFIRFGSYPIKFVLPLKSGELIKAIYLKRKGKLSFKNGVSSIIFNEFSAFIALLFFLFFGLVLNKSSLGIVFFFFLIIIIPLFFLRVKKIQAFVYSFLRKIHYKLYKTIRGFVIIFEKASLKKSIKLILYSILIAGLILLEYYLLFKSIGVSVPASVIILFMPIIILVSHIPITISGFGIREASVMLLFSQYASKEALLSAGLLISLVDYIVPAILGLFFLNSFLKKIMLNVKNS